MRNAVERISGDLCISRPKSRLDWGIELPFDKDFVTYVWFDALSNYISFAGYDPKIDNYEKQPPEFRDKWPALQVIGKDILVPAHGIYWLIMLHAIGFPDDQIPQLLVHGWWNLSGAKISKSAGNVIDPFALADKYGAEALRYYLMSDIATGKDADFSEERLIERYNADLANNLGNLLNRTLNMTQRYCDRHLIRLPRTQADLANDQSVQSMLDQMVPPSDAAGEMLLMRTYVGRHYLAEFKESFTHSRVGDSLLPALSYAAHANQLVEMGAPWQLAKEPLKKNELGDLLYHLAEALRVIAILISPVLPKAAHGIFDQLNWKMELSGKEERFCLADAEWGKLPDGHVVGKPVPLFPRIEQ